ncbi:MAG: hypothetical protein WAO98_07270 [Alphaproteobacteria bacterium]
MSSNTRSDGLSEKFVAWTESASYLTCFGQSERSLQSKEALQTTARSLLHRGCTGDLVRLYDSIPEGDEALRQAFRATVEVKARDMRKGSPTRVARLEALAAKQGWQLNL